MIDEFCELEKNVNMSLLHLIVDIYKETTEPIERLIKTAMYTQEVSTTFTVKTAIYSQEVSTTVTVKTAMYSQEVSTCTVKKCQF